LEEKIILEQVKKMGYLLVTPEKISPSYYKLKDGTIISALVVPNYMIKDPNGVGGNTANVILAFVPPELRKPESFVPFMPTEIQKNIIDDDLEFETLLENFSVYKLSDGATLSIKSIVSQIGKTKLFTQAGEPIYNVNVAPAVKVKKPE
jgi:hypothetical protein